MTEEERLATPCYVGFRPCGCQVAVVVDDIIENPHHAKSIAKDLAEWKKEGLIIRRVTVADVHLNWGECPHEPQPEAEKEQGRLF